MDTRIVPVIRGLCIALLGAGIAVWMGTPLPWLLGALLFVATVNLLQLLPLQICRAGSRGPVSSASGGRSVTDTARISCGVLPGYCRLPVSSRWSALR